MNYDQIIKVLVLDNNEDNKEKALGYNSFAFSGHICYLGCIKQDRRIV